MCCRTLSHVSVLMRQKPIHVLELLLIASREMGGLLGAMALLVSSFDLS